MTFLWAEVWGRSGLSVLSCGRPCHISTVRHQRLSFYSFHGNLSGFIKIFLRLFEIPKPAAGICLTVVGACSSGSLQAQGTAVGFPLACCCFEYWFFKLSLTDCPSDTRGHLRRTTLIRVYIWRKTLNRFKDLCICLKSSDLGRPHCFGTWESQSVNDIQT